jgi:Auxin binding protein
MYCFISVCTYICLIALAVSLARAVSHEPPSLATEPHQQCVDSSSDGCVENGVVGSTVIFEDIAMKIWNFTLAPGQRTPMHRHNCNYYFVAIAPTTLEVFGQAGDSLFSFEAKGALGFQVDGDELVQIKPEEQDREKLIRVPRVHSAKNIGTTDYYEILYESKTDCDGI